MQPQYLTVKQGRKRSRLPTNSWKVSWKGQWKSNGWKGMDDDIWLLGLGWNLYGRATKEPLLEVTHCSSNFLTLFVSSASWTLFSPDTSMPPVKLRYHAYALHVLFFCVTNVSMINIKMPLILSQELKFIHTGSARNENKRAIQVKERCEKYQRVLK